MRPLLATVVDDGGDVFFGLGVGIVVVLAVLVAVGTGLALWALWRTRG